jgi:hypothetical protein
MARFIVTENISAYNGEGFDKCLERLRLFNLEGYRFVEGGDSSDECLVFDRTSAPLTAAALKAAKKEHSSLDTKPRAQKSSTASAIDVSVESKILPEKKKSKK